MKRSGKTLHAIRLALATAADGKVTGVICGSEASARKARLLLHTEAGGIQDRARVIVPKGFE